MLFDVVNGDRVPTQKGLDVAVANQLGQVLAASGVDHDRPGHDDDPAGTIADDQRTVGGAQERGP